MRSCEPLNQPDPSDWLGRGQPGDLNGDRNGQTFARFCRPGPHRNFPSKHQNTLLLVPIGDTAAGPPPAALVACLRAHFMMDVELMPALKSAEEEQLEMDSQGYGYGPQLETYSAHEVLYNRLRHAPASGPPCSLSLSLSLSLSGLSWVGCDRAARSGVGLRAWASRCTTCATPSPASASSLARHSSTSPSACSPSPDTAAPPSPTSSVAAAWS